MLPDRQFRIVEAGTPIPVGSMRFVLVDNRRLPHALLPGMFSMCAFSKSAKEEGEVDIITIFSGVYSLWIT